MKKSLLCSMQALAMSSILLVPVEAFAEQPKATDLVGKVYGGIHAMHIETDNDRLIIPGDSKSSIDNGNGFGGEIGYRWLPSTEFRFSYSQFNTNSRHGGPEPDGSAMSADILYFPTEQNFYLLTGVNNLDIENAQISGNLGAGYRHYLSERMAVYFETKAHYQFSAHYDELAAQIGFVYFFGDNERSVAKEPVVTKAPPVVLDSDNDGIEDSRDRCPNTPMVDKVDGYGCTLYIDDKVSIKLLVSFDKSKAIVKSQYMNEIKAMADFLKANPEMMITIEGHASSTGPDEYNKVLSQKRADAIVDILSTEYSVDPKRLQAIGYGESRLFNKENTEKAHTQNRRIMAIVEVIKHEAVKR